MLSKKKLTEYRETILLIVAIITAGNLLISGFNALTLNSIQPLAAHIDQVQAAEQQEAVNRQKSDGELLQRHIADLETIKQEETTRFGDLIHRLDAVSTRLDNLIARLTK